MAEAKAQEAAKQDPKATGAGGEDLSMEEILHSIRKIIADDDPDGKKPNGKPKAEEVAGPQGSDVLVLTEMIKDDGSIESLKPDAGTDILKTIDQALEKKPAPVIEKPAEKAPEKPAEKAEKPAAVEKPPEKPVEKVAEKKPAASVAPATETAADSLLSSEAASSAAAAFKKLKTAEPEVPPAVTTPAPVFRSGLTVEDMVVDMLRPMMKDWLDKNLPGIVERIVEREVKKLTK